MTASAAAADPMAEPGADPGRESTPAALHAEFLRNAAFANWNLHRLTLLIRRMEECEGYEEYGCPTMAHYLELICGVSRIAARQRIRVAQALAELPLTDQAFATGRLSYAKVRTLVRVVTPETEAAWLERALKLTAEELETQVARSRKGAPPGRRLMTSALNAATTRMVVDLPAEEMELVTRALDEVRRQAGATLSAAESLVFLAADFLSGPAGEVKTAERYTVVVHLDEDGTAWTESSHGAAPLKPEVLSRLLCDCTLRLQREEMLSRGTRTVSEVTRRAVGVRDGRCCRVPGCKRRLWLDLHHLKPWAEGGRHQVKNLIYLCWWHHRQAHEGKLVINHDASGDLVFTARAGWTLGDTGEVTADMLWWWQQKWAAEKAAFADADDPTEDDFDRAYAETPPDDRRSTWGTGRPWAVREPTVVYRAGTIPRDRRAGASKGPVAERGGSGREGRRVPQPAHTAGRGSPGLRLAGGRGLFEPAGARSPRATRDAPSTRAFARTIPRDRLYLPDMHLAPPGTTGLASTALLAACRSPDPLFDEGPSPHASGRSAQARPVGE